jgi:hypothetical protein
MFNHLTPLELEQLKKSVSPELFTKLTAPPPRAITKKQLRRELKEYLDTLEGNSLKKVYVFLAQWFSKEPLKIENYPNLTENMLTTVIIEDCLRGVLTRPRNTPTDPKADPTDPIADPLADVDLFST